MSRRVAVDTRDPAITGPETAQPAADAAYEQILASLTRAKAQLDRAYALSTGADDLLNQHGVMPGREVSAQVREVGRELSELADVISRRA